MNWVVTGSAALVGGAGAGRRPMALTMTARAAIPPMTTAAIPPSRKGVRRRRPVAP
ncbi:hypothetical protein ACSDR0_38175 [Streptosporangium sp. G11]